MAERTVVTLGEILMRLSPVAYQLIRQAKHLDLEYGGSEANVALSLANMGIDTRVITKLPNNQLGDSVKWVLNQNEVDTRHILRGGPRLGIYFVEKGFSIRPSRIIYDREYSSFGLSTLGEYDFEKAFEDAGWFHVSGITAALSPELFEITKEALRVAKDMGLTTSCDLNFRQSLWDFNTAREKMTELMPYVDVCIGIEPLICLGENGEDIKKDLVRPYDLYELEPVLAKLKEHFGFKAIALTNRRVLSANKNVLQSCYYDGKLYISDEMSVEIVDRIGSGDAFASGLIYSLLKDYPPQLVVGFAQGSFVLKHTIEGDVAFISAEEIHGLMSESDSGSHEIQR